MKWMLGLLLASALGMTSVGAESPPDVEEFVEEFEEKRADIQTLQAHFRQHNFMPGERFSNEGELLYIRPRRLLFRYSDPPVTYAVDDTIVYEYDADLQQVQQMRL
ncbi:MAG: LolA family protein, partial [Candidatus Hydrogenedentota bacterium]